jgi:hypothetical protein
MVMASSPAAGSLGPGRSRPRQAGRLVVEVYDDSKPASRVEVPAVEVLAAGNWVVRAMIWMRDGPEDEVGLIHEVGAAKCEMKASAGVKHNHTAVRIGCPGIVLSHVYRCYVLRKTAPWP